MLTFFIALAVVTAGCIWATEHVDRSRRAELRRNLLAATERG